MLEQYSKDSAFFQSLRDRNMTIAHNDLDSSFNDIAKYINGKMLKVIDILQDKKAVGLENDRDDMFLRNIGDGTTEFDIIRNSDIKEHIINLNKFKKISKNSVIASDVNGNLQTVKPTAQRQLLLSNSNALPSWKALLSNCFEDKSIKETNIALQTLSARHLANGILGKPLGENAIKTRHIKENTLDELKFAQQAFTPAKISQQLIDSRVASNLMQFQPYCIKEKHIVANSVSFKQMVSDNNTDLAARFYNLLSPEAIPDNDILFKLKNTSGTAHNYPDLVINVSSQMDASIAPFQIKEETLDITKARDTAWYKSSKLNRINKYNLSKELRSILINKGGLVYD